MRNTPDDIAQAEKMGVLMADIAKNIELDFLPKKNELLTVASYNHAGQVFMYGPTQIKDNSEAKARFFREATIELAFKIHKLENYSNRINNDQKKNKDISL